MWIRIIIIIAAIFVRRVLIEDNQKRCNNKDMWKETRGRILLSILLLFSCVVCQIVCAFKFVIYGLVVHSTQQFNRLWVLSFHSRTNILETFSRLRFLSRVTRRIKSYIDFHSPKECDGKLIQSGFLLPFSRLHK